jgi:signal transduction histidine kinase
VARHAHARMIAVRLERQHGNLLLQCRDDGIGMTPHRRGTRPSLGILGMEERARRFGGTLQIESRQGEGTTVSVQLPLVEERPS